VTDGREETAKFFKMRAISTISADRDDALYSREYLSTGCDKIFQDTILFYFSTNSTIRDIAANASTRVQHAKYTRTRVSSLRVACIAKPESVTSEIGN